MTIDEVNDSLRIDSKNTAEWRRSRAAEYPGYERNLEAATMLDKLAATVAEIDPIYLDAYGALFDDVVNTEQHSEMLKRVGFRSWPVNAEEFVKAYIANRTGG